MTVSGAVAMGAYFALFAFVHSILADPRFKSWGKKRFNGAFDRWHRLAFTLLALLMMLPFLYILAYLPDRIIYTVPWPGNAVMAACQALSALALLATLHETGVFHFLGLAGLVHPSEKRELVTDGFYCHLRNPLFLFAALFLWLSPIMTQNLLIFNILATVYFYIGARHEERALIEEFGPKYAAYKKMVPMFLPKLSCRKNDHLNR